MIFLFGFCMIFCSCHTSAQDPTNYLQNSINWLDNEKEKVNSNSAIDIMLNTINNYLPLNSYSISNLISQNISPDQLMKLLTKEQLSKSCTSTLIGFYTTAYDFLKANDTDGLINYLMSSQALLYLDAWPKIPSRILLGNAAWFGAYDECQLVRNAHYCLSDMTITLAGEKLTGFYGTCMPNNCSNKDVSILLSMLQPYISEVINFPQASPVLCNDEYTSSADTKAFVVVFFVLVILCVLGSITEGLQDCLTPEQLIPNSDIINNLNSYESSTQNSFKDSESIDKYQRYSVESLERTRGNALTNFLICFSLLKNTRAITDTKCAKGVIHSVNGIRAISITWVILGHIYYFAAYVPVDNISSVSTRVTTRFSFEAIANAYVSVDSFFLLSGLLVSYIALKKMDASEGKLDLLGFYLHRFIRLTPSYMFSIFLYESYYPFTVNSPLGLKLRTRSNSNCRRYWWTNLLYINNLYPTEFMNECLGWSWYLANDMQFYVVSPLFLYIMNKFKLRGTIISITASILICVIVNAAIIGGYDYPALISEAWTPAGINNYNIRKKVGDSGSALYIKPYTRIAPYLVGLLLGYLLSRKVYITAKRNLTIALIGWTTALAIGMCVIYGPYTVFKTGGTLFTMPENILYGSLARLGWALALAWVIYACHYKMGGIVNSGLSWSGWIPLSRLTYGAYLLHPIVLMYYYNSLDNPLHYQDHTTIFRFLSVLVVSFILSYGMSLLIDLPVFNLEKLLMKRFSKPKVLKYQTLGD